MKKFEYCRLKCVTIGKKMHLAGSKMRAQLIYFTGSQPEIVDLVEFDYHEFQEGFKGKGASVEIIKDKYASILREATLSKIPVLGIEGWELIHADPVPEISQDNHLHLSLWFKREIS